MLTTNFYMKYEYSITYGQIAKGLRQKTFMTQATQLFEAVFVSIVAPILKMLQRDKM